MTCILITGSTGFLGRRLASAIAPRNLTGPKYHVRHLRSDLRDEDQLRREIEDFGPDWCFHLAWLGLPDYSQKLCEQNHFLSCRLFEILKGIGIKKVIATGSCFEYGDIQGSIAENIQPLWNSDFGWAKCATREALCSAGIDHIWARVFYAYGPGQRETSLIPSVDKAFREGRTPEIKNPYVLRDFVHADDIAEDLMLLAEADASGIFNLGSGKPMSVGAMVNLVAAKHGRDPLFEERGDTGSWANMDKTRSVIGSNRPFYSPGERVDGLGR